MKRSLCLLATVTLSSALPVQGGLTREQALEIVKDYNPSILEHATQQEGYHLMLESMLDGFMAAQPADTLENRYTLIALARNFDNSLLLTAERARYKQAIFYSQVAPSVMEPARAHAAQAFYQVFPQIWAVSVQIKQDLLSQYQSIRTAVRKDKKLSEPEKTTRLARLDGSIAALKADLKQLHTRPEEQLASLVNQTLAQTEAEALAQWEALCNEQPQQAAQTTNLQIKTKHKKPVAE